MTAQALLFYSLGLWAFSASRVMLSAFYAFRTSKHAGSVATITMICERSPELLLMGPYRHGGLALSASPLLHVGSSSC